MPTRLPGKPDECYVCKTQRQATNHWFIVEEENTELVISDWNEELASRGASVLACGERCVLRLVADWMERLQQKNKRFPQVS